MSDSPKTASKSEIPHSQNSSTFQSPLCLKLFNKNNNPSSANDSTSRVINQYSNIKSRESSTKKICEDKLSIDEENLMRVVILGMENDRLHAALKESVRVINVLKAEKNEFQKILDQSLTAEKKSEFRESSEKEKVSQLLADNEALRNKNNSLEIEIRLLKRTVKEAEEKEKSQAKSLKLMCDKLAFLETQTSKFHSLDSAKQLEADKNAKAAAEAMAKLSLLTDQVGSLQLALEEKEQQTIALASRLKEAEEGESELISLREGAGLLNEKLARIVFDQTEISEKNDQLSTLLTQLTETLEIERREAQNFKIALETSQQDSARILESFEVLKTKYTQLLGQTAKPSTGHVRVRSLKIIETPRRNNAALPTLPAGKFADWLPSSPPTVAQIERVTGWHPVRIDNKENQDLCSTKF